MRILDDNFSDNDVDITLSHCIMYHIIKLL